MYVILCGLLASLTGFLAWRAIFVNSIENITWIIKDFPAGKEKLVNFKLNLALSIN